MDAREPQSLSNPQSLSQDQHLKNQPHAGVHGEDHEIVLMDPTPGFDAFSCFDGEDFNFSDDAFAPLPDFRYLSSPYSSPSPNTSASHPQKTLPTTTFTYTPSSSNSFSSTSSNWKWPFLCSPNAVPGSLPAYSSDMSMQPQPSNPDPSAETDAQLGMDLLGVPVPWDSAELFPLTLDESGGCNNQTFNLDQLCPGFDEVNNNGNGAFEGEEGGESDDLAKFFLEWLKNNKDVISHEDLRSICLKKSTVECAARRLGPDQHGRMQLVKLILSWVQNHHLQKKKTRLQEASQPHANTWFNQTPAFSQVSVDSVPNTNPNLNLDFDMDRAANGCNSWLPTTDPKGFHQSCTTNGAVANSRHYSPVSDLHATDHNISWDQSYNPVFTSYPMTCQARLQTTQYGAASIGPVYNQGQSKTSMASSTKEARRKRMARQRRLLSLQQSRGLRQSDNTAQCGLVRQEKRILKAGTGPALLCRP
jgi:hypothetical protein